MTDIAVALDSRRERSRSAVVTGLLAGGVGAWIQVIRTRRARAVLSLGGAVAASAAAAAIILAAGGSTPQNFNAPSSTATQFEASVGNACDLLASGRRLTVVEMDPTTGRVINKDVEVCPRRR
jgi:xanthine/uracil permease